MRLTSRTAFPLLVAVVTLVVCSLGVHAELRTARNSIAEHRLQGRLAQLGSKTSTHAEQPPSLHQGGSIATRSSDDPIVIADQ